MKKACSNEKLAENEVEPRLLGCLRTDDLNRLAIRVVVIIVSILALEHLLFFSDLSVKRRVPATEFIPCIFAGSLDHDL